MIPLHDDNPTDITPYVTIALIAACVVVFFVQLSQSEQGQQAMVLSFGAIPAVVFGYADLAPNLRAVPDIVTLISSMFLHGGWMHLIGNMLYLWIFGNNVEDAMGHVRFIAFYIICGLFAFLGHAIADTHSQIPLIGASGAISGVLGAYALLHPRAKVLVLLPIGIFITTIRIPAAVVLGFWFFLQVINNLFFATHAAGATSDVAWGAHVGGFLAGMLLIAFFKYDKVKFFQ